MVTAKPRREVKLGCVFTQTGLDDEGQPVRGEASTSSVGAIEPSVEFGHRIDSSAKHVVVTLDGATTASTDCYSFPPMRPGLSRTANRVVVARTS